MTPKDLFFISDTHFSHDNILKFVNYEGDRVRPEFTSGEEMNEALIENWNRVVSPSSKIYHLGDVTMDLKSYHSIMPRLNGRKRLILGNHDNFKMSEYTRYFEKILESWQPIRRLLFTHRPVLMGGEEGSGKINVHGHVHRTRNQKITPQHLNISCEMTNYTPIHWDEICQKLRISNVR